MEFLINLYGEFKWKWIGSIIPPSAKSRSVFDNLKKKKWNGYSYYEYGCNDGKVLVWLKQGGMVLPNEMIKEAEFLDDLAEKFKIKIVAFDYPLAPKVRYPKLPQITYDFFHYIRKKYSDSTLILGGASAGGNLTMSICNKCIENNHPLPHKLLMYYPSMSYLALSDKEKENSTVLFNVIDYVYFRQAYLKNMFDGIEPGASPVFIKNFHLFPKTYMVLCKNDMHIEQEKYAAKQIPDCTIDYTSADHGFILYPDKFKKTFNDDMENFLKD